MGSIGRILRTGVGSAPEELRLQSSRADGLIREYEASGKGWFWETTRDGTLAYISEAVANTVGREVADLLERPFVDLISSESQGAAAPSERTLGFYLSSHVAFQDLIVRAKTKNETWWSISGRPIHDDFGRFYGYRGFASDLTKIRQSEVELDRLAVYAELGIDELIMTSNFGQAQGETLDMMARFAADVVPHLAGIKQKSAA